VRFALFVVLAPFLLMMPATGRVLPRPAAAAAAAVAAAAIRLPARCTSSPLSVVPSAYRFSPKQKVVKKNYDDELLAIGLDPEEY
jgi:hypothetical protein